MYRPHYCIHYTEQQKKRCDFKSSTTRVLHVSFSGNMQSNIILNHDCAWKSYRGMECDLNGFQSIWYVNGHVDILYSYNISFAVQYIMSVNMCYFNQWFVLAKACCRTARYNVHIKSAFLKGFFLISRFSFYKSPFASKFSVKVAYRILCPNL